MKKANFDGDLVEPAAKILYPIDLTSPLSPARLGRTREEPTKRFNLVILGDSGVGKTKLVNRFVLDGFSEESHTTILDRPFIIRTMRLHDELIKLTLSHPKGNNTSLNDDGFTAQQLRVADGIVVVYDISKHESFTNIDKRWALEIEKYAKSNVKVILVGNKMDSRCSSPPVKQIDSDTAQEYADAKLWRFFEASAKDNINVDNAFYALVEDILAQLLQSTLQSQTSPNSVPGPHQSL